VDDAEEDLASIESIAAEHGAAGHAAQSAQLIQHEVFERLSVSGS
jgi:hypothetical protein